MQVNAIAPMALLESENLRAGIEMLNDPVFLKPPCQLLQTCRRFILGGDP
jgi:hypothetical protein